MNIDIQPSSSSSPALTRGTYSLTFLILTVVFCVCLITSNIMESKVVDLGWLTITAGVIVFPISYIINDCIVEVYGLRHARLTIWLGFSMNLLVSLLLQLGIILPASAQWSGQEAMELIFGAVPRVFAASFIAFVCGSMANAYVMERMKLKSGNIGAASFSLRAIVSTLWGEGIDSAIFFPIAFGGLLPWETVGQLIVTQTFLKTIYEVAVLPLTITAVRSLRRIEKIMPND